MKLKTRNKYISAVLATVLILTGIPGNLQGLTLANAADAEISSTEHSYSFSSNEGKAVPETGKILDGTVGETSGIYYSDTTPAGSRVSFDANILRFRSGSILYLPIKDDTTKIKYTQLCSQAASGRPTYVGSQDSGFLVQMSNSAVSVTVDDITDYIKEVNGQKYFPIISGGDIKITKITLTEYNPINSVSVSGVISNAVQYGITQIVFHNLTDSKAVDIVADVDGDGKYSANLRRVSGSGSYVAIVNKVGYKIKDSNEGNKVILAGNDASHINNFEIVADSFATISGSISQIPESAVKGDLQITLIPENKLLMDIKIPVTKQNDKYVFQNVTIASNSNYSVKIENADDYQILDTINKDVGDYSDIQLKATARLLQKVTGDFVTSDKKSSKVTKIRFTNMENREYSYEFDVQGNHYTASLRTGEYETSADVDGYTVFDHVSVQDAAVQNDIYLKAPEDVTPLAYRDTIKVGNGQEFTKISDAMKYIKRMERNETQRVTVLLTDELYREQVVVDTPNVTLISENGKSPTITWYYGVGYSYYSADPDNRYYDEAYAVDKYSKNAISMVPGHWGATVNLSTNAAGFRTENIIYENSFNRYMTTEEVLDGVGEGGDNAKVNRSIATDDDVKKYSNKERACTMFIEADDSEFYNCSFLSSQDTLFTGNGTESTYFKDCIIEGTTDYICGDGDAVFDNCTLSMYGYSDKAASGSIIVASKQLGESGYLFSDCKVVTTTYPGINKAINNTYFARPWRAGSRVTFLNTQVEAGDTIAPAGYTSMSGANPSDAVYAEYNTHTPDNVAVGTDKRAKGVSMMKDTEAAAVKFENYFGTWQPAYFENADYSEVDAAIERAGKLTQSEYVDFAPVTKAIEAVVRNYKAADQKKVDDMAKAINDAVKALVEKKKDVIPVEEQQTHGKDAPAAKFNDNLNSLVSNIFTSDEIKSIQGGGVSSSITLDVQNSNATVTEAEKKAANSVLQDNRIGIYLDIRILKKVGTDSSYVKETKQPIRLTLEIPEALKNTDTKVKRVYQVIKIHDGVAQVLQNLDDTQKSIIIETAQFSTYVIVYQDQLLDQTGENPEQPGEKPDPSTPVVEQPEKPTTKTPDSNVPILTEDGSGDSKQVLTKSTESSDAVTEGKAVKTGDNKNIWIYMLALGGAFGVIGGGLLFRIRKRSENKK